MEKALCIVFICWTASSHALLEKSDDAFQRFLENTMQSYPTWLKENSFDPASPSDSNALLIESIEPSNVSLHCELTANIMRGHSTSANQVFEISSNFSGHSFGVKRVLKEPYWFTGNFNCTGSLNEPHEDSFYFTGNGTYLFETNSSEETLLFENVGVTKEYKLDLSSAWLNYKLELEFCRKLLVGGTWNDSRVEYVITKIESEFGETYSRYLKSPYDYGVENFQPSLGLSNAFLANKTQGLDLKSVMEDIDLPPQYPLDEENGNTSHSLRGGETQNTTETMIATASANKTKYSSGGFIFSLVLLCLLQ